MSEISTGIRHLISDRTVSRIDLNPKIFVKLATSINVSLNASQKAISRCLSLSCCATRPKMSTLFSIVATNVIDKATTMSPTATFAILSDHVIGATDDLLTIFPMATQIDEIFTNGENEMRHVEFLSELC